MALEDELNIDDMDKLHDLIEATQAFIIEMQPDIDDTFDKNPSKYFIRLQMSGKISSLADDLTFF